MIPIILKQKRQFLYQPGPLSTIILWSWTIVVLCLSIILALELSNHFWIPWVIGAIFIVLVWAQIHYRHIYLENGVIRVSRILNHNWVKIRLSDVRNVHASKYRLGFVYGGKIYQFLLPVNSVIELNNLIQDAQITQKG